jgi:hypothetical protein
MPDNFLKQQTDLTFLVNLKKTASKSYKFPEDYKSLHCHRAEFFNGINNFMKGKMSVIILDLVR